MPTYINPNDKMDYIMKTTKSLKESGLLIKIIT